MSTYAHIDDLWADLAEGLVLDQYKDSANLKALIKIFVDEGQTFEDAADRLRNFWNIDTATGALLDLIGAVRRITRTSGETDDSYRARIKIDESFKKSGTPDYVIQRAIDRSGDSAPVILEEDAGAPVVFILTSNGRQLTRNFANSITPAGVLGAPAAAIVFANGKRMVNAEGMLYDLVTDEGDHIVDDEGNTIAGPMRNARTFLGVALDKNIAATATR